MESQTQQSNSPMVRADRDRTLSCKKSADVARACDIIHSTVARLQTDDPGAFLTINGNFNHAKLPKTLTGFTQYVKCSTRENKILDMMYANVKEA
ncbi:hypothetical protein AAFF_G00291590 [Aldrovandia affinis]|uniref:Uncharacterized protein n=1 Tax=Aldrovandia affinis TaxID=143900 RepID=A0AAD7SQR3_9TELE|nr:hypothetical protein AAFF_G00291590 [Aldrovandia affinis]